MALAFSNLVRNFKMMVDQKTPGMHTEKKVLGDKAGFFTKKTYYTHHYPLAVTSIIPLGFAPILVLLVFHVFKVFNYPLKTFDYFPIKGGNT